MENLPRNPGTIPQVAIIGCGNIGSRLDEQQPTGAILTHASAYQRSGLVHLRALCDASPQRLHECGQARGVSKLYTDYQTMLRAEPVDILSICTPTMHRLPLVQAAIESGVRIIFCEKPLAYSLAEAEAIYEVVQASHTIMAVNYLRRWDPSLQEAASTLRKGQIGQIQHAVTYYGKGILNNGSHMIDLLNLFFGIPLRGQILRRIEDQYSDIDPTLDCILEYADGEYTFPVHFLASDYRHYSLFELDIIGTAGRIRIYEKGQKVDWWQVGDDVNFPGYATLTYLRTVPTQLHSALLYAVQELVAIHQGQPISPRCDIQMAIESLRVVDMLKQSIQ